jgi:pimeloyl-ACP methyl ester carboxylesterase
MPPSRRVAIGRRIFSDYLRCGRLPRLQHRQHLLREQPQAAFGHHERCGWEEVARPLAAFAQIVLYDRPGIGRSGQRRGTQVLLASTVADELLACLHAMDMPPPYLLVGHSLGGFYMQAFARTYPCETAAVVLIDSASPLEPPRVFGSTVPPKPGSIMAAEEAGFAPSAAAMLAGPPFPPVPLIVLVATDHGVTPDREALWQEVQKQTAALSPKGRLKIVQGRPFHSAGAAAGGDRGRA